MKAIILSAMTAVVAVAGIAAPANAVQGGFSLGGNGSLTSSSYGKMGVSIGEDGVKAYFTGETVYCSKSSMGSSGGFTFGSTTPVKVEPTTLPSATPDKNCDAQAVVNNPDPATTVTVNGVCGDPAELAKIMKAKSNVIINSTGPCPTDGSKPATTPTVIVTPKETVKAASVTSPKGNGVVPAEMPQTGAGDLSAYLAGGAGVLTYAGFMAVRAFRRG